MLIFSIGKLSKYHPEVEKVCIILVVSMIIMIQFAKVFRFHNRNLPPGRFGRFQNLVSELSNRLLGFGESDVESDSWISNRSRPKYTVHVH